MVVTAEWWPRAARRPVTYAAEAGMFTRAPLGWVLHVTCMDGSPWGVFEHAKPPNRRFSHLWVSKTGQVEQYAPLSQKAWAQGDGNAAYWSVETDGQPTEPLTAAQVAVLAEWHAWSGTVDALASRPGDPGIGTHYMGGKAWGAHSCPDPAPGGQGPRSRQRADVIAAARRLRTHQQEAAMPLTTTDLDAISDEIWGPQSSYVVVIADKTHAERTLDGGRPAISPITALAWCLYGIQGLTVAVKELAEQVKALRAGGVDVDQLAAAVASQLPQSQLTQDDVRTAVADVLHTAQP